MKADRRTDPPTNGRHRPGHPSPTDRAAPKQSGRESAPKAAENGKPAETPEPDAVSLLVKQFRELGEYFSYYAAAKTDSLRLATRNALFGVALAALGFVAVSGFILVASWFLLSGLAEGLAALMGGQLWLGHVICGMFALLGVWLGLYAAWAYRKRVSRERTLNKYEQRQARQRAHFGRDVRDQSAGTASHEE